MCKNGSIKAENMKKYYLLTYFAAYRL